MKTRFTQWSMVVALLIGSLLNAQEDKGHVGINPKGENVRATLDVQVSSDNENGTTNEGIIYPTLNKTRLANIADASLVEGTVVYVDNITYSGANTKVSEVGTKGFYYYNAGDQKWKKLDGKNYTGQNGVAVAGNIIKGAYQGDSGISIKGNTVSIEAETKHKIDEIDVLSKNRLGKWDRISVRRDRAVYTGTAGTWSLVDGHWKYSGLLRIYAVFDKSTKRFVRADLYGLADMTFFLSGGPEAYSYYQVSCLGQNHSWVQKNLNDLASVTDPMRQCGIVAEVANGTNTTLFDDLYTPRLIILAFNTPYPVQFDANGHTALVRPVDQLWRYDE